MKNVLPSPTHPRQITTFLQILDESWLGNANSDHVGKKLETLLKTLLKN